GPGIPDDMMEEVYCTYAASTKRDDADMTGGFGLGSKAPWSYTESFTVTSHHNNVKMMYLMSRVSDEAEGKPGMTTLMSFKTEESGLSVSVPLEDNAMRETKRIVKDVLYLSGIKAQIHFEDRDPVLVESMEIQPAQYVMDDRPGADNDRLYAVYGGVRYLIPHKEEYAQEFEFMNLISEISSLYIGFAPHTLSPLPNREGLNMSTKTKESIRVGLELCMERFQEVFDPVIHAYFRDRMDHYKAGGVQPHYALYHAVEYNNMGHTFMKKFYDKMKPLCPPNTDTTVWEIALRLMTKAINPVVTVIGESRWMTILLQHFIRVYPDHKHLAFKMMKQDPENMIHTSYRHKDGLERLISSWVMPTQLERLYQFENQLLKDFPEDKGFVRPKIRLKKEHDWPTMERHRNAPKGISYRYLMRSTRQIGDKSAKAEVTFLDPSNIWASKDGEHIQQFIISNTVILAKTVNALRDTDTKIIQYFSTDNRFITDYHGNSDYGMIPAYVVHSRKGWYDKALKILTNLGFKVIEANEPERKIYKDNGKPRQIVKQYCRINTSASDWKALEIDPHREDYDPDEHGVPLENPTHYLYVKQWDLEVTSYSYRGNSRKPSKGLVHFMTQKNPDVAMVNNIAQAQKLEKDGVKKFEELVIDWKKTMGKKVYRLRNIVRVIKVMDMSNIPESMITDHQIQAAMGIAKIKHDDLSFWEEMKIIKLIKEEYFSSLQKTAKEMEVLLNDVWRDDPQKERIRKAILATDLLSETKLANEWHGLDKAGQDVFASKIARFIRTL
ncbi:MAG: ATP-binding protein, partial [Actinobacteria bacterium]|nr:ATP-binding protein [Actinomycetota bacterium]